MTKLLDLLHFHLQHYYEVKNINQDLIHLHLQYNHLLIYLDFNIDLVAVEYNKEILDNSHFDNIFMQPRDSIEVITIVGGG